MKMSMKMAALAFGVVTLSAATILPAAAEDFAIKSGCISIFARSSCGSTGGDGKAASVGSPAGGGGLSSGGDGDGPLMREYNRQQAEDAAAKAAAEDFFQHLVDTLNAQAANSGGKGSGNSGGKGGGKGTAPKAQVLNPPSKGKTVPTATVNVNSSSRSVAQAAPVSKSATAQQSKTVHAKVIAKAAPASKPKTAQQPVAHVVAQPAGSRTMSAR